MSGFLTLQQVVDQHLHVVAKPGLVYAIRSHLLPLTVADLAKAVCDFPALVSRNSQDGSLMLSALCSFIPGENLFADQHAWHAVYQPLIMQAYPCYCVGKANAGQGNVGQPQFVFASDQTVLTQTGLMLVDEKGALSSQAQQLLQNAQELYEQERQTFLCLQQLQGLQLFRAIELQLETEQGGLQRIRGLMTIDEDKLLSLDGTTLQRLQQSGGLQLAQSMLNSLLQLNRLIQKHNQRADAAVANFNRILKLKIEIDRDQGFL